MIDAKELKRRLHANWKTSELADAKKLLRDLEPILEAMYKVRTVKPVSAGIELENAVRQFINSQ